MQSKTPSKSTRLVGRAGDLRAIAGALENPGVVTLVGPGGVGKTSLCKEALESFSKTAYFAGLESAADDEDVLRCVSAALELPAPSARPGPVAAALGKLGPGLLAIDNAEHVLDSVRRLVDTWTEAAPLLRIVVTSRERLGVQDEHVLRVSPLQRDAATALFVERAREREPGFALGEHDDVGRLVDYLDHLPLAIELAAARVSIASVSDILARVEEQSSLLRQRDRDGQRHGSLDACIAWSAELLGPDELDGLLQLAVFSGPFALPDAEAVVRCGIWTGDLLETLLEKSLVTRERVDDGVRFRLFETVRRWCRTRSSADPELAARWAEWLRAELETERSERHAQLIPQAGEAFDALLASRPELAVDLLLSAERAMRRGGAMRRLVAMFDAAGLLEVSRAQHAGLKVARASTYLGLGRAEESFELLDEAELVGEEEGLDELCARIHQIRGYLALGLGRFERAEAHFVAGVSKLSSKSHPGLAAYIYGGASTAALQLRKVDESVRLANLAMEQARRSSNPALRGQVLVWKANGIAVSGELPQAAVLLSEAMRQFELARDYIGLGSTAAPLAEIQLVLGSSDIDATLAAATHAADIWDFWLTSAMVGSAVARRSGDLEEARRSTEYLRNLAAPAQRGVVLAYATMLAEAGQWAAAHLQLASLLEVVDTESAEGHWLQRYGVAFAMAADEVDAALGREPDAAVRALLKTAIKNADTVPLEGAYSDAFLRCEYGFVAEPLEILRGALGRGENVATLELQNGGRLVVLPDGTRVDLSKRHTLRRFLVFMVEQHEDARGQALDLSTLMAGGWPDQTLTYDSGSQRVYAAIKQLRKLGFGDVVLTGEDGYLIDPTLEILRTD